jgi:hypothetical protein
MLDKRELNNYNHGILFFCRVLEPTFVWFTMHATKCVLGISQTRPALLQNQPFLSLQMEFTMQLESLT